MGHKLSRSSVACCCDCTRSSGNALTITTSDETFRSVFAVLSVHCTEYGPGLIPRCSVIAITERLGTRLNMVRPSGT